MGILYSCDTIPSMTIAIIGGGLTGLTAAYELLKEGHQVTLFEKEKTLGGLAGGLKQNNWKWSLEYFYHHFFTNDSAIIDLSKELGLEKELLTLRPITATLIQRTEDGKQKTEGCQGANKILRGFTSSLPVRSWREKHGTENASKFSFATDAFRKTSTSSPTIFQLDSPMSLLTFPLLSPIDKLRTAALLGFCKLNPFWQPLEKMTAEQFFKTIGGIHAWNTLWEPLMYGKFGDYAKQVPASWLWARFHKRTMNLGYFRGGFQTFIDALEKAIIQQKGTIIKNAQVQSIIPVVVDLGISVIPEARRAIRDLPEQHIRFRISLRSSGMTEKAPKIIFNTVLITIPSRQAVKLIQFPKPYETRLGVINHLYAQTLILETRDPVLDTVYWLNINDRSFPFLAVVAHTNMVDKKFYGGNHITYIGNYLPEGHPYLKMNKQQLFKLFLPYLKKINPSMNSQLVTRNSQLFTAPSAQPIHTLNYSKKAPPIKTPIEGIYLANLDSIYPWDRGTNYAVELGQQAARTIIKNPTS